MTPGHSDYPDLIEWDRCPTASEDYPATNEGIGHRYVGLGPDGQWWMLTEDLVEGPYRSRAVAEAAARGPICDELPYQCSPVWW